MPLPNPTYAINFSDPLKLPIIVPSFRTDGTLSPSDPTLDGTAVNASTPIIFYGRGHGVYGERFQENMLNIMENFANTSPPVNGIEGQTWYNTTSSLLHVFDGADWSTTSTPNHYSFTVVLIITSSSAIVIDGKHDTLLPGGQTISVKNTTSNDGTYVVSASSFNGTLNQTTLFVTPGVVNEGPGGNVFYVLIPVTPLLGQFIFDPVTNELSVYDGSIFVDVILANGVSPMTGSLTLSGPPTLPLHAVTKTYADTTFVNVTGDTMTGTLTMSGGGVQVVLPNAPTLGTHATNKTYVDAAVAGGPDTYVTSVSWNPVTYYLTITQSGAPTPFNTDLSHDHIADDVVYTLSPGSIYNYYNNDLFELPPSTPLGFPTTVTGTEAFDALDAIKAPIDYPEFLGSASVLAAHHIIGVDITNDIFYIPGNYTVFFPSGDTFAVINSTANDTTWTVFNSTWAQITLSAAIVSSTAPSTFTVGPGNYTAVFTPGRQFTVAGTATNNGTYTVVSSVFSTPNTVITVTSVAVNTLGAGGTASFQTTVPPILDIDATTDTFTIGPGNFTTTFTANRIFEIANSTAPSTNDGTWITSSSAFTSGNTVITVMTGVPSGYRDATTIDDTEVTPTGYININHTLIETVENITDSTPDGTVTKPFVASLPAQVITKEYTDDLANFTTYETIIAAGALSEFVRVSQLEVSGGGAITLAAPDVSMIGWTKIIEMTVDTGNVTLVATNIVGYDPTTAGYLTGANTFTFANVGETVALIGGISAWILVNGTAIIT